MTYVDPNFDPSKKHFDDDPDVKWEKWGPVRWCNDDNPFPRLINQVAIVLFGGAILAEIFYLCYYTIRYGLYQ